MILHKASQQQQANDMRKLFDKMTPRLKKAFLLAINNMKGQVNMRALTAAVAKNNISEALTVVNVDSLEDLLRGVGLKAGEVAFDTELVAGFAAGATAAIDAMPFHISTNMAFDLLNPNTVRFVENYRVPLIRELTKTTREGVQYTIQRGLLSGKTPRKQATEIRELIGLTKQQSRAILNFREQLETRLVGTSTRPDKRRLSAVERRIVARHMKEGGLSPQQTNSLVSRYYESLVNRRALNIARTEAVRSSNLGQLDSWKQAQRKRLLSRNAKKKWIVTNDDRLRQSHREIPSMNRNGRGINELFSTPEGSTLYPPLGTNCRCTMVLSAF